MVPAACWTHLDVPIPNFKYQWVTALKSASYIEILTHLDRFDPVDQLWLKVLILFFLGKTVSLSISNTSL